jgi:hypothetical protein
MSLLRMDNVLIVVDDLEAATAFFVEKYHGWWRVVRDLLDRFDDRVTHFTVAVVG